MRLPVSTPFFEIGKIFFLVLSKIDAKENPLCDWRYTFSSISNNG